MTPDYDDPITTFVPSPSPISEYMGKNVILDEEEMLLMEPSNEQIDYWYADEKQRELLDPEAAERLPTFRRLKVSDIQNLADPQWLIGDLIPEDSFSVIYGPPGSTKSFLALDLACCVATGIPWKDQPVRQGKVMVCVGEGLRGLKWRLESWMLAHPEADPDLLEDNLEIIEDVPHLLEKADTAMLLNTAIEMHEEEPDTDLKLFVIDTLARALVGGDENSAQDVGRAIDACEKVRKATGATALVVHHSGVEGTRERGSTALRGAADTSIQVAHDETQRITTVSVKKIKDGEGNKSYRLALAKYGHSVVLSEALTGIEPYRGTVKDPFRAEKTKADWAREALARKESPF